MIKETYIVMEYPELEKLVKKEYGIEYEYPCDMETSNDSSQTFQIEREILDEYDQEQLDKWKISGKGNWMAQSIMTDLCNKGILESGNYLINVCW